MFVPLVTMAVAQFFDFGTFVFMVELHGASSEANPLVGGLLENLGIPAAAVAKVALVVLVGCVALLLAQWAHSALHRRLTGVVIGVAIVAGIFGGGTNALTIGL